jgi:hypothetical protein
LITSAARWFLQILRITLFEYIQTLALTSRSVWICRASPTWGLDTRGALPIMKRLWFFACAGLATAAPYFFRPYPVSNPSCTIHSSSAQGTCGGFTYKFCETPEGSDCNDCVEPEAAALTGPPGFFEAARVEDVVSADEYLLYKMLEVEYLVEFSKNPMSFQTPIDMPYCGLASGGPKLENRKRGWWEKVPGGKVIVATANELKNAAKQIEKGIASIGK